jgi:diguanylate cyclase (GGDEF)-like protein
VLTDLLGLAWPRDSAALFERRRAEALAHRTAAIALAFAAFTVAWIAVDAAVFPTPVWERLAVIRVITAVALVALARTCRVAARERSAARSALAALFLVPAIFFAATLDTLSGARLDEASRGIAVAYTFMPFLLAAGIGAFPLALAESAALALFALGLEGWALATGRASAPPFTHTDALWLLALIAAVAAFAAAAQLELMLELVKQANRDALTGCLRRESGQEMLEMQYRLAARSGTPLAVLFADIDRFKAVNDDFGHEVGDRVLAGVAAHIGAVLRSSDILVRWGGEEFVVGLPLSGPEEAEHLVERLRSHGLGTLPDGRAVTVSIGIAEARADSTTDAEALVELADQRMYMAKQAGRNCYVRVPNR